MRFTKWNVDRRAHEVRVRWAPSRLRRVARHPALWLIAAIALVAGGTVGLVQRADQLEAERDSWGGTRPVAVVVQPVSVGEPLSGAVEIKQLPRALVAESAVASVTDQAFARVNLYPGEILLRERLNATEIGELPNSTAALTVTLAQQSPLVDVGDLVDLWTVDTTLGESHRIARRVVVLAQSGGDLTVAVPEADVGTVALAAVRPLTAALVG